MVYCNLKNHDDSTDLYDFGGNIDSITGQFYSALEAMY